MTKMLSPKAATPVDYAAILAIAAACFPAETLLPECVFAALLSVEPPCCFMVVRCSNAAAVGYVALWPMRAETLRLLATGALREADLTEAHLADLASAEVLYVLDVCCSPTAPEEGPKVLRVARGALLQIVSDAAACETIAAWPQSPAGQRLCGSLGMRQIEPQGAEIFGISCAALRARLSKRSGAAASSGSCS